MTKRELKKSIRFLKYFGTSVDGDVIKIYNDDTMLIMNSRTSLKHLIKYRFHFKEFVGRSIGEVAERVAKELGKEVQYID